MEQKLLTPKKKEKIALLGNCIFSEARLFPYKSPLLIRVPLSILEDRHISLAEAKNLITAINNFVGTNESFIVFLNGSIFRYQNQTLTMEFTESLETLEGISLNDEKENLILWVYGLTDLEDRFSKIFLNISELVSNFNEKLSRITFGNKEITLPPTKNEFNFCNVMFRYKINEPIDWSVIWNEMDNTAESVPDKKYKNILEDITYLINKRVKRALGSEKNLFTWKHKNISRNF